MAKDFAALQTALNTDARYDTAVRGKSLQPLMALLNAEDTSTVFVYFDTPIADVLEAAGAVKLKGLTPDERGRLGVLKQRTDAGDVVALSKSGVRAEMLDVFGITETQLAAGIPAVRRKALFAEAFGFERVVKEDLWKVLPNIAKSYMAVYLARG